MILLRQNQTNQFVLTLSELANPSLPNNWLLVFELEQALGQKNQTYKRQFVDISVSPISYNMFELIEGTDIDFKTTGDYHYKAYQMPDNVSVDETQGILVEQGKMRLLKENEPRPIFAVDNNVFVL